MDIEKRYHALKYNPNFEKLNVEFLIMTLAKNIDYIFLAVVVLWYFGFTDFNLNPSHFPHITLAGEWAKVKALGFNPITIYGHYLWTFFLITKGFILGFIETVRTDFTPAFLVCLLIVNIWLAYNGMKYGYSSTESKRHNAFIGLAKDFFYTSNLLERSLWMMFFIDLLVFLTTPERVDILFILAVYLLILSVKLLPLISRAIISASISLEKTFLYNEWLLLGIGVLNAVMIYVDNSDLFALFIMILVYNAVASIIFRLLHDAKGIQKYFYFAFNIGIIIFFFSLVGVYLVSFALVMVVQSPLILAYYYRKKKFLPVWVIEVVNGAFIAILLYRLYY